MAEKGHFARRTFGFLRDLAANNNREWFQANKGRYESDVKEPALRFIQDFAPRLAKLSPHFRADPRANGGSLFRIYRDVRFSKDKSPYKSYTGIQFRHEAARDAHAPGFYLHLEPGDCFIGVGIWRPDGPTVRAIRQGLVDDPKGWKGAINRTAFKNRFELTGDRLVRPPKGFDPGHPLIEDLKWKDYIAFAKLTQKAVTDSGFLTEFTAFCRAGLPYVSFLCRSLGQPV